MMQDQRGRNRDVAGTDVKRVRESETDRVRERGEEGERKYIMSIVNT